MSRHGWFRVVGQHGDRSVEEQLKGLAPALAACKGKTVLDLGCAEGAISREFAKAGAKTVVGIELLSDHLAVARQICNGLPVQLIQSELKEWIEAHAEPQQFDIVLALSIAHKLHDPGQLLTFAARSCREMLVFRGPGKQGMFWGGNLRAKFGNVVCNVPDTLKAQGLTEGETLPSGRDERVQYWYRH